jgi:leucine dehydrogenase
MTAFSLLTRNDRDAAFTRRGGPAMTIEDIGAHAALFSAFDGHELVLQARAPSVGLDAIIAIHDTTLGTPLGGTRMRPYRSRDEAITDALRLSRAMTMKSVMSGLNLGGGKAVLIGDPATDKSAALMHAYGDFLNLIDGRFSAGQDAGLSVADLDRVAEVTPHVFGSSLRGGGDPSPDTAIGVAIGIGAAVRYRIGAVSLSGISIAVQGLGHVGAALCDILAEQGARLFVADIDPSRLAAVIERTGATAVAPTDIHRAEADVFSPCALGGVLDDAAIGELRCAIVAGAANNPLGAEIHGEALRRRGILYAPDYVINAGGLIHVASELHGWGREETLARIRRIAGTLAEIFARADAERAATNAVAERMARERIAREKGRGKR